MATLLVVDDEIGIRELLEEILSDEGHTVDLAENAQQARAYRARQRPDLVLLDIWMPDMDGVTLLKEWAADGLLTMPVVMMSGHATIDTAVEATKIGALNFLEKPISLQKLLDAVENGLVRGRLMPAATPSVAAPVQETSKISAEPLEKPSLGLTDQHIVLTAGSTELAVIDLNQLLRDIRDHFERVYFEYHLKTERGSMTRVAEKTGLERTHLYRKLKQLGIDASKNRGIDY
jgi:DNA-binding NtrC family response regulator